MKTKSPFLISLTLIFSLLTGFFFASPPVLAASGIKACSTDTNSSVCKTNSVLVGGILRGVINVMLYLAGTIAVVVIVIGALRYITSDGDPAKASTARLTIIYALVGLVVAVLSFSIVNFVLGRI